MSLPSDRPFTHTFGSFRDFQRITPRGCSFRDSITLATPGLVYPPSHHRATLTLRLSSSLGRMEDVRGDVLSASSSVDRLDPLGTKVAIRPSGTETKGPEL